MRYFNVLAGAIALAIVASPAVASPIVIPVTNFDFSADSGPFPYAGAGVTYSVGAPTGWHLAGGSAMGLEEWTNPTPYFNYEPTPITAYSNGGALYQVVTPTAIAGATYTLTAKIGAIKYIPNYDGTYFDIGYNGATAVSPFISQSLAYPTTPYVFNSGDWYTVSTSYTATANQGGLPMQIVLFNAGGGSQGDWTDIHLSYTLPLSPTPEPATWAMVLIGFGTAGAAMRSRRKVSAAAD